METYHMVEPYHGPFMNNGIYGKLLLVETNINPINPKMKILVFNLLINEQCLSILMVT